MDAKNLVKEFLTFIGENPEREGLKGTPERVVKSWEELYRGYHMNPADILQTVFAEGSSDEMVVLRDIDFISMCEHHILPFIGKAHIGYIPNGRLVGVSKLARLVDAFARRLQIQEKMTLQIAKALEDSLAPLGVAVVIQAHHQCMSCRGIGTQSSNLITSAMLGAFRNKPDARQEFLGYIRTGGCHGS